jgi:hypothetical protein
VARRRLGPALGKLGARDGSEYASGHVNRRRLFQVLGVLALAALVAYVTTLMRFPSDRTPEGAYLRVAKAVNLGEPADFFAYLETPAQHAAYTIIDYRKKARERILTAYPEPDRTRLAREYETEAAAPDGKDLFAIYAERRGWMALLRKDLSGIESVEVAGERATVETVRGTRYAFRKRENGIWGMTLFTAALATEAERAARDYELIDKAARDYAAAGPSPQ